MKKKSKYDFNNYLEFALFILALICFAYFLQKGNTAKTLQPILIVVVLTFLKVLIKLTKVEISFVLRFSILIFIFVAMFLAVEFDFYERVPGLDKIEHLCSGIILVFIGFLIFKYINRKEEKMQLNPLTIVLFSLFFSMASAGFWEIFEFTVDRVLGLNTQNGSLFDTMGDIICGTTGAIITSIYLGYRIHMHDKKFMLNQTIQNP